MQTENEAPTFPIIFFFFKEWNGSASPVQHIIQMSCAFCFMEKDLAVTL